MDFEVFALKEPNQLINTYNIKKAICEVFKLTINKDE